MFDAIVIGGGPAGLSAALVLGRQRRDVLVIDGGAPRNVAAAGVHMYLGCDGCPPLELLARGRADLLPYPTVEIRDGSVLCVGGAVGGFSVELADGTSEEAARLILATGQLDSPVSVPGLPERFGRSVFHCPFCHGFEASGKSLAVVGALVHHAMQAVYLKDRYSDDVVLCTHGAHDLAAPHLKMLADRGIEVREDPLSEVDGELDALVLRFVDGSTIERDVIFHRAPTRLSSSLSAELGCALLPDGCVKVDEFQRTSVPGVFAAGDTARLEAVPEALTFALLGAADGVRAAVWLEQELFVASLGAPPTEADVTPSPTS